MNTEHYREAAAALDRTVETLRIRADKLDAEAETKLRKANRARTKAGKLASAAKDLRAAADAKARQAENYRKVALIGPQLERSCLGCALGYVPEGETYNGIHSCGQTVGSL